MYLGGGVELKAPLAKRFAFTLAEGATHVDRKHSKRRFAFTLAEVLITLGIIGIVAAMTLPTLINDINDKQFKVAFKKQYSAMAQAMQRIYAEDGSTFQTVDWLQMPAYFCKLQKQMRVIKSGINCDEVLENAFYTTNADWPRTGQYYWHASNTWFDKQGNPQFVNPGYRSLAYVLPDGGIILHACTNDIFIDVNGTKKPNTIGRDIFFMEMSTNNMVPVLIPLRGSARVNGCTVAGTNATPTLTMDNYKDDCLNGSGWGCSLLYLME